MTATELKNFWRRSPFEPFDIVVPGRSKLHVPHPDFLTVSPTGRTAHVWMKNGDYAVLDVFFDYRSGNELTRRQGRAQVAKVTAFKTRYSPSASPSTNRKSVREGVPPV